MKTLMQAAAAAVLATLSVAGHAQNYPTKPIRLIIPYAPGGATDSISRLLMTELSRRLGQPITVENKGGANSILGLDQVAKSPPDGYTLGVAIPAYSVNYTLYKKLPYKDGDLVPVGLMYQIATLLMTGTPGVKNLDDLKKEVAARKAAGTSVSFASSGIGSMGHLKTEVVVNQLGLGPAEHIPYRGSAASWPDMMSGRVLMSFDTFAVVEPMLKDGKLTALMVVGNAQKRLPQLPNVPTATEMGMPDVDTPSWGALMAPKGTPKAIQDKLAHELREILNMPEIRSHMAAGNVAPFVSTSPAQAAEFVDSETRKLGAVVKTLGLAGSN